MTTKPHSTNPYLLPSNKIPDKPEACYALIIDEIITQPTVNLYSPGMRLKEYFFEGEQLGIEALKYLKKLSAYGFTKEVAHKALLRARAAIYADNQFRYSLTTDTHSRSTWSERSSEAIALRSKLVRILKLVCMKQPEKIKQLVALNRSKKINEVLKDLASVTSLGRALPLASSPVTFDQSLFDEADILVAELFDLHTAAQTERRSATDQRIIRDQAITLLNESVSEIKGWSYVAFQDSPTIRKKFRSKYARNQYLKRKNK
ncbi:MAG: hypothetical protein OCD01_13855 [Fibrobacterales bacterium]